MRKCLWLQTIIRWIVIVLFILPWMVPLYIAAIVVLSLGGLIQWAWMGRDYQYIDEDIHLLGVLRMWTRWLVRLFRVIEATK